MKPMAALNSLTPKTYVYTNINLLAEFVTKLQVPAAILAAILNFWLKR